MELNTSTVNDFPQNQTISDYESNTSVVNNTQQSEYPTTQLVPNKRLKKSLPNNTSTQQSEYSLKIKLGEIFKEDDWNTDSEVFRIRKNKFGKELPRLTPEHYQKLVIERFQGKIPEEWVLHNCYSVDKFEASEFTKSSQLGGGVWLTGADGYPQLMPDYPKTDIKEDDSTRKRKYESPSKRRIAQYDATLPRHPGDINFWADLEQVKKFCIHVDGVPCLLVTEGLWKAIVALHSGMPCVSLPGVQQGLSGSENHTKERELTKTLQKFKDTNFGFIVGFDADAATKHPVKLAELTLAEALHSPSNPVYSISGTWESNDGEISTKGIDDYILHFGANKFIQEVLPQMIDISSLKRAYDASPAEIQNTVTRNNNPEYKTSDRKRGRPKNSKKSDGEELTPREQQQAFHDIFGGQLKFNEMTLEVEYDTQVLDVERAKEWMIDVFDYDGGKNEEIARKISYLARKQPYHPVRTYLESVERQNPNVDETLLDNLAERYFGTNEPLYNIYLKKTLVGLVKRIFEPGCQHDTASVLQGIQGINKSKFWENLVPYRSWYDAEVAVGGGDKDDKLKLRAAWIIDLSEIEVVFRKNDVATLRNLLTTKNDKLRPPYGRKIETFPRMSGFVGTVNQNQFLNDPEGNRRFWVIPVKKTIPIELLNLERDLIWAAAIAIYKRNEKYNSWLTQLEGYQQNKLNLQHTVEDSWSEAISNTILLLQLKETTICEILNEALKIAPAQQGKREQMRASDVLKLLGWEKGCQQRRNGINTFVWHPKLKNENELIGIDNLGGVDGVLTEVLTPLKPDTTSVTAKLSTPSTPFSETYENKSIILNPLCDGRDTTHADNEYTKHDEVKTDTSNFSIIELNTKVLEKGVDSVDSAKKTSETVTQQVVVSVNTSVNTSPHNCQHLPQNNANSTSELTNEENESCKPLNESCKPFSANLDDLFPPAYKYVEPEQGDIIHLEKGVGHGFKLQDGIVVAVTKCDFEGDTFLIKWEDWGTSEPSTLTPKDLIQLKAVVTKP